MGYTLNIYRRLIGMQMRAQLQYRVAFVLEVVAAAVTLGTYFAALALVLERFGGLGGWGLGEVALLWGMVELAFGTMDLLFGGFDPGSFGQRVRRGSFDQLLLRPLSITLQVLGSEFILRRVGRMAQGLAILLLALNLVEVSWTPAKLLYLPLALAGQVCFFGGLFIIGATITFWTVESIEAMNIFTYGGSELMAYPMQIYPDWLRRFFTFVIPAGLLNYYPALFLLDKPDPFHLPVWLPFVAPLVGPGVLLLALAFWRFGIRHYQSTGS
jgi:ABC-2 type transport system permease protein